MFCFEGFFQIKKQIQYGCQWTVGVTEKGLNRAFLQPLKIPYAGAYNIEWSSYIHEQSLLI